MTVGDVDVGNADNYRPNLLVLHGHKLLRVVQLRKPGVYLVVDVKSAAYAQLSDASGMQL